MVGVVAALVLTIVVTRLLGPEGRGVYFVTILAASLSALLLDLGISTAAISLSARRESDPAALHGLALAAGVVAAGIAAVVFVPNGRFWADAGLAGADSRSVVVLLAVSVGLVLYSQAAAALLVGLGRVAAASVTRASVAAASPFVAFVLLEASDGAPFWGICSWSIGVAAQGIGAGVLLASTGARPRRPSLAETWRAVGFGVRAHLGTASHQGLLRVDVLFISARLGAAPAGVYSIASVLAERLWLVGSALYTASASRIGGSPANEGAFFVARIVRLLLVVLIPVAAVLALVAKPLIVTLYGDQFAASALPFVLLLPGATALAVWYVVGLYIISALRAPGRSTLIQGGAFLLALPAYWFAVAHWGMNGAAATSSLLYGGVAAAGTAFFLRRTRLSPSVLVPRREDVRAAWRLVASLRARPTGSA